MSQQLDRRAFLKAMGVAAGASFIPSADAFAQEKNEEEPVNFSEPEGLTGEPISLPEWKYGDSSTSTETMLMFRGNPTHTFYGTGPVSEKPKEIWSQELARFYTTLRGRKKTWTGTGWSGQPSTLGDFVFVGG